MCLYEPGLGYYVAGAKKIGLGGDFITAPEISSLYSACIAKQVVEVFDVISSEASILEFGPGTGQMGLDILIELNQLGRLPEKYYFLELSPDLTERQRNLIKSKVPNLYQRCEWLTSLEDFTFTGVILANEILDAQPVTCFELSESGVVTNSSEGFNWAVSEPNEDLNRTISELPLENALLPYRSEINDNLLPWFNTLNMILEKGVMLLMDYGYECKDYYHSERTEGTLIGHYQQHAIENPFFLPGLSDITCNVDFTAVAKAGQSAGLEFAGYTNQSSFLIGAGLEELFSRNLNSDVKLQMVLSQQVKLLTLPSEMGERFKFIGFSKNLSHRLSGFTYNDMSHKL